MQLAFSFGRSALIIPFGRNALLAAFEKKVRGANSLLALFSCPYTLSPVLFDGSFSNPFRLHCPFQLQRNKKLQWYDRGSIDMTCLTKIIEGSASNSPPIRKEFGQISFSTWILFWNEHGLLIIPCCSVDLSSLNMFGIWKAKIPNRFLYFLWYIMERSARRTTSKGNFF